MTIPRSLSALLALSLLGCGNYVSYDDGTSAARPPRALGPNVAASEVDTFGHRALAGLLAEYASEEQATGYALIDYDRWAADSGAMLELERSAELVASIDPGRLTARADRVAFWLNVYNMSVIRGALARLEPGFRVIDDPAFFSERAYTVGGVTLSLDQIEHGVMRGEQSERATGGLGNDELSAVRTWHEGLWEAEPDPRLHAAVNCGARGCPDLLVGAPYVYEGARLEEQLAAQTRAWVNDETKGAGPNGISMIFTWFASDFDAAGGVRAFVEAWRDEDASSVDYESSIEYDWTLNGI